MTNYKFKFISLFLTFIVIVGLVGCGSEQTNEVSQKTISIDNIPPFSDSAYIAINDNIPQFAESEITTTAFETYGELDYLSRCTTALACLGTETMPTDERGKIGSIKPSGWQSVKYDIVDGKYLFNRCHLIGWQLSAENSNKQNLITGTRYMNTEGMLPFENMVADYIKETNNHVMYRVTPIFSGTELVARGVQIEAYSVEDKGEGVCFNVYCYNNQPNIEIDYSNGDSYLAIGQTATDDVEATEDTEATQSQQVDNKPEQNSGTFILNTNSMKFHSADCPSANDIKEQNKSTYTGDREYLIQSGYSPCGKCKP